MHGSPCQDFSLTGSNKGGDEGSGTRSSLMYQTIRIVEKLSPKYVIWENVKNLLSKTHIHNFENYLKRMESLGYKNYYKLLNSNEFGIPQNRWRVFAVSIKADQKTFFFPKGEQLNRNLMDYLEKDIPKKYFLSDKQVGYISAKGNFNDSSCIRIREATKKGYSEAHVGDGVNLSYLNGTSRRGRVKRQQAPTIPAKPTTGCVDRGLRLRKLTPKEYFRLMGFEDSDFYKASQVTSETQLYKQAGNSIVVNVLEAIFKSLLIDNMRPSQKEIFEKDDSGQLKGQMNIFDFIN